MTDPDTAALVARLRDRANRNQLVRSQGIAPDYFHWDGDTDRDAADALETLTARFNDLQHNLGLRAFTAPDEDENVMLESLDARIMSALADAERLKTALRLTAEYVGPELLPPIEGWSWYDALEQS